MLRCLEGKKATDFKFKIMQPTYVDFESSGGPEIHSAGDHFYVYYRHAKTYYYWKTVGDAGFLSTTLFGLEPILGVSTSDTPSRKVRKVKFGGRAALMIRMIGKPKNESINLYLGPSTLDLIGFKTFEGDAAVGLYDSLAFHGKMSTSDFSWSPPPGSKMLKS